MDVVVLIVLVVGMGLAWWWLSRRRRELLDREEPEEPTLSGAPEVFTRDALVNRSRRFDPGAWDDSPDAAGSPTASPREDGDLPTFLDREYLERRNRPAAPAADEEPPAAPPAPPHPS